MEVTMRASVFMEKLWGMDFNAGHPQGQWRNDVFNEWGAIVNCSGDICDGLWINGSPAACGSSGGNHGGADVSVQRTTAEQILTLQPMKKDPMPEQL
ncbi:MORN repeat-containing protein 1 [Lathamus discolor]|uniref:MORN repeat-containing protein 1 n=1 Tax=Lathamus discolor TaxID=678569 RepID=UPI0032B80A44